MSGPEGRALEWSLGLRNRASGKYLTQETFGFALNCNGGSLKKKQTLYLEPTADGRVNIRTHLNRYFVGLADGTFKADAESVGPDTAWTIEAQVDGTWALKSAHGYYAHGSGDKLSAFTKDLPADGKWVVHLAMHPQINLLNIMRKRFAHLEGGELHCNEDIPWGEDALINFIFFDEHPDGRYGIMASNGQYLSASGRLVDQPNADCQFLLGFHDNCISLRDSTGSYMSCVGSTATMKANKDKVTKDELFRLQDSEPQFTMQDSRSRYVSIRSSTEVKADQTTVEDTERFQFEIDADGKGSFKTSKSKYWTIGDGAVIAGVAESKGANEKFVLEYHQNRLKIKGANGKYLTVMSNGKIQATGDGSEETSLFCFTLINRPRLLLRGQYGFVGAKGASGRLEVTRARGDIFEVVASNGAYHLRASNGKFWGVDADGVHANSGSPVNFYFEFVRYSKFLIRTEEGHYLEGEQNGGFRATGANATENTLWEY